MDRSFEPPGGIRRENGSPPEPGDSSKARAGQVGPPKPARHRVAQLPLRWRTESRSPLGSGDPPGALEADVRLHLNSCGHFLQATSLNEMFRATQGKRG